MTAGPAALPSFAQDDDTSTSPMMRQFFTGIGMPSPQTDQDAPAATPPGFSGFTPQTPPTDAPTPVLNPNAVATGAGLISALGPSSAQAAEAPSGQGGTIPDRFVGALQQGGLTNPNGLGAVAAYAQHESGYSPSNITGSWSDPSQSGQPGTSGGILSWRGDRLDAMKAFTAGAADPVKAQASFMIAENPALTQALQNAQSPQEANALMARAWKFAGYDQPGGENAARLTTTQDYANRLANGMQLPASAGGSSAPGRFGLAGPTQAAGAGATLPSGVPAARPTDDPEKDSSYADIMKALQGAASKGQGQDKPKETKWPAIESGGHAMSLKEARAQFDPGRFFAMLKAHGVRGA